MELIDKNKLKAHYAWWQGGTRTMTMDTAKGDFDTIIDLQPTVDAVEVVRCKDCKYYDGERCHVDGGKGHLRHREFYCGYGERREDA